jgi:M6 family metalloprotease-like protein
MSVPFNGRLIDFAQPDGTLVKVRAYGNNRIASFESEDGYAVGVDPQSGYLGYLEGGLEGAAPRPSGIRLGSGDPTLSGALASARPEGSAAPAAASSRAGLDTPSRWEIRRQELRQALEGLESISPELRPAPPERRTVGTFFGLCVPVQFPDVPASISRDEIEAFCNKPGYNGYGNNGSVRDYFRDVSAGRVDYSNVVTPYYTTKNLRSYYTDPSVTYPFRAQELIREVLNHLKSQGFDASKLTVDADGYVFALNVFYAGRRVNAWSKGLWPHQYTLNQPIDLGAGRKMADYQITDIGTELTLGTFCHENGHMLCDFPDLYDYAQDNVQGNGVGAYCLMCAGANASEKNPTDISAYLKYKAGWVQASELTDGTTVSAVAGSNQCFIRARNPREYFLIENRQATGRDAALPASGLAVWHVDELGDNENQQMTSTLHYECSIEQADNSFDLERGRGQGDPADLFHAGNKSSFGDTTTPNSRWWDGSASGLELSAIGPLGAAMSLTVGKAGQGGGTVVTGGELTGSAAPGLAIPDNSTVGVTSSIAIAAAAGQRVVGLTVTADITHTYRGDLVVKLIAPSGAVAVLHNRAGAGTANLQRSWSGADTPAVAALHGQAVGGTWNLSIVDQAAVDSGRLNTWGLRVTVAAAPESSLVELDGPSVGQIPDADTKGVKPTVTVVSTRKVREAKIRTDITHSYIGDLVLTLVSPKGTRVVLHNRAGGSSDNIIRTFDLNSTPGLSAFAGEAAGGLWGLEVVDHAAKDIGKLNGWRLSLTMAD